MPSGKTSIEGLSVVALRSSADGHGHYKQNHSSTSTMNAPAESLPTAALDYVQAPPKQQQSDMQAQFWDQQIAQGNLSMCSVAYPTYVNVMLYGESGLGKTTCIMNLIGSWGIKRAGSAFQAAAAAAAAAGPGSSGVGESGKTSLEQFRRDPDSLKVELMPIRDDTSNLEMHFSFQDMPGWGDDINLVNSLKTVVDFLLKQRQKDYIVNKAGLTEECAVPGTMIKHGITVCLYFVPPHRVKPIDWIMMAAISKLVAVIPVIAKADTFTSQEMEDFRQELLQVIQHSACSPHSPQGSSAASTASAAHPSTPSAAPGSPSAAVDSNSNSNTSSPRESGSANVPSSSGGSSPCSAAVTAAAFAAITGKARTSGNGGKVVAMPIRTSHLGEGDIRDIRNSLMCPQRSQGRPDSQADGKLDREDDHAVDIARELCLETYTFRESDLHMVGASDAQLPPFAIVSSKDIMTAEDAKVPGGQPGQPFRRYRWGTALPLNRDHSDLIILKQLLFGHRNFAVHDLLQDSWRRAHAFAKQYEALVRDQLNVPAAVTTLAAVASGLAGKLPAVSLQPLVDALCSSTCGGSTELADKLRSEEAKRVITDLSKANEKLRRVEEDNSGLRKQVREQGSVIQQLVEELEGYRAKATKKASRWRL